MLRLKLFGAAQLFHGEAEIRLPSRGATLPLLAYLALHRAERISRSRLAFTLWPDEPEEVALHDLRRKLYLLLKALPPTPKAASWVLADADTIVWNDAAEYELDVAQFELLRREPATLEQAVTLYDGDLLEEIYDDWVAVERERLRGLFLADLSALIVANRSRRAFDAAARYAQRLLRADPWREDAVRHCPGRYKLSLPNSAWMERYRQNAMVGTGSVQPIARLV